jgi:TrmH family RNA methyltransferase
MRYSEITSPYNPIIKNALKIKKRVFKKDKKEFLIDSPHLLEMALSSDLAKIKRVFFTERFLNKNKPFMRHLDRLRSEIQEPFLVMVSDSIISRLSDTEAPQGIVSLLSYVFTTVEDIKYKGIPFLVICDGIQDPGNIGTIIRVADAAGADAVIIMPNSCDIFNPKALRATSGSIFNIPVIYTDKEGLLSYLRGNNILLYATDIRSDLYLYKCDLRLPLAIAFGSEAHGIRESILEISDYRIKIPIIGKAESLNVAMAAAISLYEIVRQRMF